MKQVQHYPSSALRTRSAICRSALSLALFSLPLLAINAQQQSSQANSETPVQMSAFHVSSIRDETYRYICYRNGDDELYDFGSDLHEWKNLASDPGCQNIKEGLRRWLPRENAADIEVVFSKDDEDGRSSVPEAIFGP